MRPRQKGNLLGVSARITAFRVDADSSKPTAKPAKSRSVGQQRVDILRSVAPRPNEGPSDRHHSSKHFGPIADVFLQRWGLGVCPS